MGGTVHYVRGVLAREPWRLFLKHPGGPVRVVDVEVFLLVIQVRKRIGKPDVLHVTVAAAKYKHQAVSSRCFLRARARRWGRALDSALANNGHQGGRRACHGVPHRCRALGRCVQSRRTPRAPPADTVGLPPAPPARCAPDPPASLFAAPTAPALVCGAPRSVAPTVGSHRPRAPRGCRRKSRRRVCAEGPWAQPRNSDTPAGETAWG